jgi:drug/metabolite transporter (DMT)-like permease
MKKYSVTLLLLGVTVLWGYTFSVVQTAAKEYGVASFLTVRFALGLLCLAIVGWNRVSKRSLLVGAGIGIPLAVGYYCQTLGLRFTTSTSSGLITSLLAVAAPLFNRILFGVRTRPLLWIAVGLTMLGMVLLTGIGQVDRTEQVNSTIGDLLTLVAAISFGLHIVFLDRYSKHHDTIALTIGQTAMSVILFAAAWPMTDNFALPSQNVWMAILLTGIGATAIGFYVQTFAQRELPAARVVVIVSLEAVFTMFFAYVLVGERLAAGQFLGALLMLAAVALAEIVPVVFPTKVAQPTNDCLP